VRFGVSADAVQRARESGSLPALSLGDEALGGSGAAGAAAGGAAAGGGAAAAEGGKGPKGKGRPLPEREWLGPEPPTAATASTGTCILVLDKPFPTDGALDALRVMLRAPSDNNNWEVRV